MTTLLGRQEGDDVAARVAAAEVQHLNLALALPEYGGLVEGQARQRDLDLLELLEIRLLLSDLCLQPGGIVARRRGRLFLQVGNLAGQVLQALSDAWNGAAEDVLARVRVRDELDTLAVGVHVRLVPLGVIIVPVRVDDVAHRRGRDLLDLAHECARVRRPVVRIDDDHIIGIDDERPIAADRFTRSRDGRVDAFGDLFDGEDLGAGGCNPECQQCDGEQRTHLYSSCEISCVEFERESAPRGRTARINRPSPLSAKPWAASQRWRPALSGCAAGTTLWM